MLFARSLFRIGDQPLEFCSPHPAPAFHPNRKGTPVKPHGLGGPNCRKFACFQCTRVFEYSATNCR